MMGEILRWLQERIKLWTKPATSVLIIGKLSDLTHSYTDLVISWSITSSYFNQERLIEQRIPDQYDLPRSKPTSRRITSKAIWRNAS